MDGRIEIAGIGACVADTLYRLEQFPAEDTKQRAAASKMAGGGPVATGIVTAARLGCASAYLGCLSGDAAGRFLEEDFLKYGVDTSGIIRYGREYRSFTSCIWLNEAAGSRTCIFDKGSLPPYELDSPAKQMLKKVKILMTDGNELDAAVAGAEYVHRFGGRVLYDAGGLYPDVERLLACADVLIPSAEFATDFTGKRTIYEAAEALHEKFRPDVVVITDGRNGGLLYHDKTAEPYPAFPVDAVDTNGAGDVFHGAFAAALTKGFSYHSCCLFASMTSALKCRGFGARESVPDYDRVIKGLREKGVDLE